MATYCNKSQSEPRGIISNGRAPVSMREIPGSTPGLSTGLFFISSILLYLKKRRYCFV